MGILEQLKQHFSEPELDLLKNSPDFTACLGRAMEIENLLPVLERSKGVCQLDSEKQ